MVTRQVRFEATRGKYLVLVTAVMAPEGTLGPPRHRAYFSASPASEIHVGLHMLGAHRGAPARKRLACRSPRIPARTVRARR